jgi:hypothetical protein
VITATLPESPDGVLIAVMASMAAPPPLPAASGTTREI